VRKELVLRGAYFLNEAEKDKVRAKIQVDGHLNAEIVGQSVKRLAEIFGIGPLPAGAKVRAIHTPCFLHASTRHALLVGLGTPCRTPTSYLSPICQVIIGEVTEIGKQEPLSEVQWTAEGSAELGEVVVALGRVPAALHPHASH
jgi:hypothetical protein